MDEETLTVETTEVVPEAIDVPTEMPADIVVAPDPVVTEAAGGLGITTIVLIVVGVILLWVALTYNKLIHLRVRVKEAWSDIEVQLKRRYNLIPNLVESVKGYMGHEKEVLENVTKARAAAIENKGNPEAQGQSENMLTGALKTLFAVSENYPDLKANQNFLDLQRELTDTEDKIQAARRFYNGNVRELNTKVQLFPINLIAGFLGFKKEAFFEVENEEERKNVKVDFKG